METNARFDRHLKEFCQDWIRRHPLLGTAIGLHGQFDALMPDGSLEKEEDDLRFLRRSLREFEKMRADRLTPDRAVERELVLHVLRNWIFDREVLRDWERTPEAPRVVGEAIFQILSRNYAPLQQRMRAILKRLERIPRYVDQSRSKLRAPTKMAVEIELEAITRLPGFFNALKDIGREHLSAGAQSELNRQVDHAQNALERYSDWLIVDVLPDCREEHALGEGVLNRLLRVRGVGTAAQISAAAEAELARLTERQREVAREIRRRAALEDVRDLIKQQHPENFDGALRYLREAVGRTRQFVARTRFAELPEGDQLYVIETPAYLRHILPFGGYWPPARHEARTDGYLFLTPGDCDSDKLKEHNYAALANHALRLGYPGRHLQMSWAIRHPSPLRALYTDPVLGPAWAEYAAERARELGYDDAPAVRFMHLQASALTAVQALLDLRLALGRTGFQEAVENLIDRLGMDRVCAEAEVRRYLSFPGAAATAFWGRERFRELRRAARERLESRFSDALFHTAVLRSGPVPFPVLQRELEARIAEEGRRPAERAGGGAAPGGPPPPPRRPP